MQVSGQNPFAGSQLRWSPTQGTPSTQTNAFSLADWSQGNMTEMRRKNKAQQPDTIQKKMQEIQEQQQEIENLKKQLANSSDPLLQKQLAHLTQKMEGIQRQIALGNKGIASGLAGNEGKVDHVGGFVTFS